MCFLLSLLPWKMWKMASSSESSKTRRAREQMHAWLLFLNLTIFQTPLFCFWGIWLIIFRSKQEALQTSPSVSSLHPPTHPSCLLHNFWRFCYSFCYISNEIALPYTSSSAPRCKGPSSAQLHGRDILHPLDRTKQGFPCLRKPGPGGRQEPAVGNSVLLPTAEWDLEQRNRMKKC